MIMRSCVFARDNSLFTLCTQAQMPTYLIKWSCGQKEGQKVPSWSPEVTKEVHHKPSTGMRVSRSGTIAVLCSDGHLSLHEASSLNETTRKRRPHVMPITAAVFRDEEGTVVTAGLDYKYCILPQTSTSILDYGKTLLFNVALLLVILLYFAEWL